MQAEDAGAVGRQRSGGRCCVQVAEVVGGERTGERLDGHNDSGAHPSAGSHIAARVPARAIRRAAASSRVRAILVRRGGVWGCRM